MPSIKIAKNSGFCFGVKKAIEIAEQVAEKNNGQPTYVLGQLVHNERVIDDLEKKGIVFVDDIQDIPQNAITVLRAHGEPGTTYQLKGKDTFIVENAEDSDLVVNHINKTNYEKYAIISQTTMSVYGYEKLIEDINSKLLNGKFEEIPLNLKDLTKKFGYVDTICNPTKQRQSGTEELAREPDIMIIIGGLNSSNSKELYAKCKEIGVESYFIQSSEQINPKWFDGKEKIGVTAGASTPDYLIGEAVEKIKEIISDKKEFVKLKI